MTTSPAFDLLASISFGIVGHDGLVGTGFLIARGGWALTALHVVKPLDDPYPDDRIPVLLGEREHNAVLVAADGDLALLRIDGAAYPGTHVPLARHRSGGRRKVLVCGYQGQRQQDGLVPIERMIDEHKPVVAASVPMGRGTAVRIDCLMLNPVLGEHIHDGSSGAAVLLLDPPDFRIVGVVSATAAREHELAARDASSRPVRITDQDARAYAMVLTDRLFAGDEHINRWWRGVLDARRVPPPVPDAVEEDEPIEPSHDLVLLPIPGEDGAGARLGMCHVTNRQYLEFLRAERGWRPGRLTPDVDRYYLDELGDPDEDGMPTVNDDDLDRPVVAVSYRAAKAYAEWAGERLGLALRLPTCDEWLLAARGDRGDGWDAEDVAAGCASHMRRNEGRPHIVTASRANPSGFYDLLGNVHDLCEPDGDGLVPACGGWWDTADNQLADARLLLERNECRSSVGFRCAAPRTA